MPSFVCGSYQSGNLSFQFGKQNTNVTLKTPSLFQRLFHKTVKIAVHDGDKAWDVRFKLNDLKVLLESSGFRSSLLTKQQLVSLFYKFIHQDQITENKPLRGKCLNGKITLEIWKDDSICVANFWQKIFRSTTKLSIQDGNNLRTYNVLCKDLTKKSQSHGIDLSKASNLALIDQIRGREDNLSFSSLTLNAIPGQFLMTQSAPTYNKKGQQVKGSEQIQESLLLGGLQDHQFALTVYNKRLDSKSIFLEVDGREFYIKAEELADRYHLSLEKILKYAAEGNLAELLNTKQIKFDLLNDIIANYARLFEKQNLLKKSDFKSKNLMKIVRIAIKNKNYKNDPILKGRSCLKGKEYLPMFRGNKLQLLLLTHKEILGIGSLSQAFKVSNAITKKHRAIKIGAPTPRRDYSLKELYEVAQRSIENEFDVLQKLHAEFPGGKYIPGILRPPFAMTFITENGYKTGILSTGVCDDDLYNVGLAFDSAFDTLDKKIDAFYELLKGYEYTVLKKKLRHGDTKPENILCKGNKLFLADFGDARILEAEPFIGSTTPGYFPIADRLRLFQQGIGIGEFNTALTFKDIYGLGASFFFLLSGQLPYNLTAYNPKTGPYNENSQTTYTPEGNPPRQAPFRENELRTLNVPEGIIEIVKGMTELNPDERMGIREIITRFDAYRAKRGQPILNSY